MAHTITTKNASFTLQTGDNLLEALERTGHSVEYQCRQGYCGSCRLKLLKGQVRYAELPLAFIAPNEVLPCCCMPVSNLTLSVTQTELDSAATPDFFTETADAKTTEIAEKNRQEGIQGELF